MPTFAVGLEMTNVFETANLYKITLRIKLDELNLNSFNFRDCHFIQFYFFRNYMNMKIRQNLTIQVKVYSFLKIDQKGWFALCISAKTYHCLQIFS